MEQEQENKVVKNESGATKKEARIVVSAEAEAAVGELTDAVNDGFEAGRATRFDVATYMLLWFKNNGPEDAVAEIRRRSSDGHSMLDALQKRYKSAGELPLEIQLALEKHFFGEFVKEQKKLKKSLKQEYITDIPKDSEAA